MKKKALLIFLNQDFDINKWKDNGVYDRVLVKKIDTDKKILENAHPDTGEYKYQVEIIKTITTIAEDIAHFLNKCDEDGYTGYVSLNKLPNVVQMWTYLALGREKEIKFVKISQ